MSDDLNKKIKQIADILGQEGMSDNLMGLISLLAGSLGKESASPLESPPKEERSGRSDFDESFEMVRKIKQVMDRIKSANDPKVNLLVALKPFMSSRRQKKLDSCIKILHMSNLTRYLDEHDNSGWQEGS